MATMDIADTYLSDDDAPNWHELTFEKNYVFFFRSKSLILFFLQVREHHVSNCTVDPLHYTSIQFMIF